MIPGGTSQSSPAARQSSAWTRARVASPRSIISVRSAGGTSRKKPAVVYGGSSTGTWPSTKPITKNGVPSTRGSGSYPIIGATGTSA